jgi:hypothetical protein
MTDTSTMTDHARVSRAVERLSECTTDDDLARVWDNCQLLLKQLVDAKNDEQARRLLNAYHDVRLDLQ